MNMASIGVLLFIFTVIYASAGIAKAFVNVRCNTENVGQYGQNSLLECVVKTTQDVPDAQIRVVTWKKEGDNHTLLLFHKGKISPQPRYSFAEPSWNYRNMNVSLLIKNTSVQDDRVYECMVMTNSGLNTVRTCLKVKAKYNVPVITYKYEMTTRDTDATMECNSDGGYPEGRLRWFDEHNKELTDSAEMEVKQTKRGLFQLSSRLTLLQGQRSIFSKYTCVVFNGSGGEEEDATFEIPRAPETQGQGKGKVLDPTTKIVAPVVVIGSLIIGLLLVLLIYRRRFKQAQRHTTPLMGDHERVCTSDIQEGDHQEMDTKYQGNLA